MENAQEKTLEQSANSSGDTGNTSSTNNTFLDMCFNNSPIYGERLSPVDFSAIARWPDSNYSEDEAFTDIPSPLSLTAGWDGPEFEMYDDFADPGVRLIPRPLNPILRSNNFYGVTSSPLLQNHRSMLPRSPTNPRYASASMDHSGLDSSNSSDDKENQNCASKESNTEESLAKRRKLQ